MRYEETFIDWEKMFDRGILEGFVSNNFQTLYEYLYKRKGVEYANTWALQSKRDKKKYCAELITKYIKDNDGVVLKAQKYLTKCLKRDKKLK